MNIFESMNTFDCIYLKKLISRELPLKIKQEKLLY